MERYVGVDPHGGTCRFGVMSAAGKRLNSLVVETNGRALVEAVRGIGGRGAGGGDRGDAGAIPDAASVLELRRLGVVTECSSDRVRDRAGKLVRAHNVQTRGLSRKRHPRLKAVFKGAATTVIAQLAADPLHADYQRMLKSGIRPTMAKLTLARKIAATVLSMWKHQEVYDPKRHRPTPEQK